MPPGGDVSWLATASAGLDSPALLKTFHCPAVVLLLACCGESVLLVSGRPTAMLPR